MTHPHRGYLPRFHVGSSCIPRLSRPSKNPKNPNNWRILSALTLNQLDQLFTGRPSCSPDQAYILGAPVFAHCSKVGIGIGIHSQATESLPCVLVSHHHLVRVPASDVIPLAISVSNPSQRDSYNVSPVTDI